MMMLITFNDDQTIADLATFWVLTNQVHLYVSMTSLLAHTVAQPNKRGFLLKNFSQLVIELALT